MRLDQLLAGAGAGDAGASGLQVLSVRGDPATTEVTGITHDSRRVRPGFLYCCVRGRVADGHDFAPDAVASGARSLLCERVLPVEVAQVHVDDVRQAMGPVAAAFFGHPSRQLSVVGITGTNGKTTTAYLLRAVLDAHGQRCGVIGTLSGPRTTPEATDLQELLSGFVADGMRAAAVEVSSHALDQHRVDGTAFSMAVFTNLGRDHLDYHRTEEEYFRAKARLFDPGLSAAAVVNGDDPHGRLLRDAARIPTRAFTMADAEELAIGAAEATFRWRGHPVRLMLGGAFNVMNALAAATAASELGVPERVVAGALSEAGPVPGRFEPVDSGQPFSVIVDYAHTPDGLEQVLAAARAVAGGRVLLVFGCGGDRDRLKRPSMGDVASRLADVAVLTTDNPRHEDPDAIIAEVGAGAARPDALVVEPDRRAAISLALSLAQPGDVVVIAGKGHETTQVFADREVPFDDRAVAREELARRR